MAPPYAPGNRVAWIDTDPEGIRVHRATVVQIDAASQRGRWLVTTDRGSAVVDPSGQSGHILPIDADIATELYLKGDGFLVRPTASDQQQVYEQHSTAATLDHEMDLGDDLDFD